MQISGNIRKLQGQRQDDNAVRYALPIGDALLDLSPFIGKRLKLSHSGKINCVHCGRATKKSYQQGHCFPCMKRLASCDLCIVKPELCHYAKGTCREPEWGEAHCLQDHIVYLANTSGLKVGITRAPNIPSRWIDQGASAALPIFQVATRLQSGELETLFAQKLADKSNWRALLKGKPEAVDLIAARDDLFIEFASEIAALQQKNPEQLQPLYEAQPWALDYPVLAYPSTIRSLNLDKTPVIDAQLQGIKGQYLIFDQGVMNLRKYSGYELTIED